MLDHPGFFNVCIKDSHLSNNRALADMRSKERQTRSHLQQELFLSLKYSFLATYAISEVRPRFSGDFSNRVEIYAFSKYKAQ